MAEKGIIVQVNIPLTLTGAQDNLLKTVFDSNDDAIGVIKFTPLVSKNKFESYV